MRSILAGSSPQRRGWAPAGLLDTYHDERHFAGARAMMQTQAQAALRRENDPAINTLRELFLELMMYEQPLRHMGELIAGTDLRYAPPNSHEHALTGTFVPDLSLHTQQGTTSVAALMHAARPVLLCLTDGRNSAVPRATGTIASTSMLPRPTIGRPTPC